MSYFKGTEESYQKFIDLQEKLRKSEEDRLILEMKFNKMMQITREEDQFHGKQLKQQYKHFLQNERLRAERNEKIFRLIERIEDRAAVLAAKTDRFNLLRRQYQAYLHRIYNVDEHNKPTKSVLIKKPPQNIVSSPDTDILKKYLTSMPSQRHKDESYDYKRYKKFNNMQEKDDKNTENTFKTTHYAPNKPEEFYSGSFENSNYPTYLNSLEMVNLDNTALSPTKEKPSVRFLQDEESSGTAEEKGDVESIEKVIPRYRNEKLSSDSWESVNVNVRDSNQIFANDGTQKFKEKDSVPLKKEEYYNKDVKEQNLTEQNPNQVKANEEIKFNAANYLPREREIDESRKGVIEVTLKDESKTGNLEVKPSIENLETRTNVEVKRIKDDNDEGLTDSAIKAEENINLIKQGNDEERLKQFEKDKEVLEESEQEFNEIKQPIQAIGGNEDQKQKEDDIVKRYDENIEQSVANEEKVRQYDQKSKPIESHDKNSELIRQYDENAQKDQQFVGDGQSNLVYSASGQELQQYNENGQAIQQFDANAGQSQEYNVSGQPMPQYDATGQAIQQYDETGQVMQQYDENGQAIQQYDETGQAIQQYDETGQAIQQYDETGQVIQQYDENGQPIQQYDNNQQNYSSNMMYDENGQLIEGYLQYDEHGQPMYDPNLQYDENGQLITGYDPNLQYDENGQPITGYDPNMQYDENGQPIAGYDPNLQYDENGQIIQGYDENGQPIPYDANVNYGENVLLASEYNNSNYEESGQEYENSNIQGETSTNVTEPQTSLQIEENESAIKDKKPNVIEMLDTDTESTNKDTKVSNESDFDFSNK